jgi:hypothetical protein
VILLRSPFSSELLRSLVDASKYLSRKKNEDALTKEEANEALNTYKELQILLSVSTRTGDWTAAPSGLVKSHTDLHDTYQQLVQAFDDANELQNNLRQQHPAAIRPLGREALSDVNDVFIIEDNSLRETTVGAIRGHTLEEKHKIVDCIAESGLDEVILGAYGSKISVDSQIPARWRELGNSFDSTWGFSDTYDFEAYDEAPLRNVPINTFAIQGVGQIVKRVHGGLLCAERGASFASVSVCPLTAQVITLRLWEHTRDFIGKVQKGDIQLNVSDAQAPEYYVPEAKVKHTYSEEEAGLFKRAYQHFPAGAFGGKEPEQVLKESESDKGRIPMGLLMMCGYGIKNAILEVDVAFETFDFETYDLLERFEFLLQWTKWNFPRRNNAKSGEDNSARVFLNSADFTNWKRSDYGQEEALHLIDRLYRLPDTECPFGFFMEEPQPIGCIPIKLVGVFG